MAKITQTQMRIFHKKPSLVSAMIKPFKWCWIKWRGFKRRYKFLSILFIIILFAVFFWWQYKKSHQPRLVPATASIQTIERKILRSGTLEYKGINQVFSDSDGQVDELLVSNGDVVEQGDVLFSVVSTANPEEKAQAWSNYLISKNTFEKAKLGTTSTQSSYETARQTLLTAEQKLDDAKDNRDDYTDKEVEALESAVRSARLQLDLAVADTGSVDDQISAAQASLQVAWLQYQATQDLTMTATTNGRVENLSITEGDIVSHTDTTPALLLVSNPEQVLAVEIGEIDAALLQASQSAQISVDAFPNQTFAAHVVRVDSVGTKGDSGVSYTAWMTLDEVNPKLLAGMAADVEILIETKENVLAVPNEAITYKDEKYFVTLGCNNLEKLTKEEEKAVEIGIRNETHTEITSGLATGQSICVIQNE